MRLLIGVLVLLASAACSSSMPPGPDAELIVGVHFVAAGCDVSWNPRAATYQYCEHACIVKPFEKPCNGKTPCADQEACPGARDYAYVEDCPSTFVATDRDGTHRGCCMVRTSSTVPVPSFYECPAP